MTLIQEQLSARVRLQEAEQALSRAARIWKTNPTGKTCLAHQEAVSALAKAKDALRAIDDFAVWHRGAPS